MTSRLPLFFLLVSTVVSADTVTPRFTLSEDFNGGSGPCGLDRATISHTLPISLAPAACSLSGSANETTSASLDPNLAAHLQVTASGVGTVAYAAMSWEEGLSVANLNAVQGGGYVTLYLEESGQMSATATSSSRFT